MALAFQQPYIGISANMSILFISSVVNNILSFCTVNCEDLGTG